LQRSISGNFSDMVVVGTTSDNMYSITVGDLMDIAEEAGLDNDPNTPDIPNTGTVSFRVRAFAGTDSNTELITSAVILNLILPEETAGGGPSCDLEQMWAVGAGVPDAGWGWTTPIRLACIGNDVYGANVNLQNMGGSENNFRFFTDEGDWNSGQNYPYFEDAGYTIDSNFENANDGDSNFAFKGTTGYYYLEIDTANKTIVLDEPKSFGTCEFEILYAVGAGLPNAGWGWTTPEKFFCEGTGVYTTYVELGNDTFRFFTSEGDWNSGRNYPYYADAGYTIDSNFENANDGDSNFRFIGAPGIYKLTVDDENKTITLE